MSYARRRRQRGEGMDTNDVAKLAAAYAAGELAYDGIVEALGGDGELVDKVLGLAGGVAAAGLASEVVDASIETLREVPIAKEALDVSDVVIRKTTKLASDTLDTLNPLKWDW